MKNNLKLSHYLPHHYHDNIYNDYPGKSIESIEQIIQWMFFFLFYKESKYTSICAGCGCQIYDQYLLKVSPDLEWHIQCLKCYECGQHLDETTTCFVLDGKTFCKFDYIRYVSFLNDRSHCMSDKVRMNYLLHWFDLMSVEQLAFVWIEKTRKIIHLVELIFISIHVMTKLSYVCFFFCLN